MVATRGNRAHRHGEHGSILEKCLRSLGGLSLKVFVVNARHVKQVPGRKTDVKDSHWLAALARFGLLKGSFIPEQDLRELRVVTRYRTKLTGTLSSEKNRLHKVLDDAGIHLGNVVTDINRASAHKMIQGLILGQPINELVQGIHWRFDKKMPELKEVLSGTLSQRHRFVLEQIHSHISHLENELQNLDDYILNA